MLLGAALNVMVTFFASPTLGHWAPAIGYSISIALCNGLLMNWYYQRRVGLDMVFFWRRNMPTLIAGIVVTALCLTGGLLFPVDSWVSFLICGVIYTVLFVAALWFVVLSKNERTSMVSRFPLLERIRNERDR